MIIVEVVVVDCVAVLVADVDCVAVLVVLIVEVVVDSVDCVAVLVALVFEAGVELVRPVVVERRFAELAELAAELVEPAAEPVELAVGPAEPAGLLAELVEPAAEPLAEPVELAVGPARLPGRNHRLPPEPLGQNHRPLHRCPRNRVGFVPRVEPLARLPEERPELVELVESVELLVRLAVLGQCLARLVLSFQVVGLARHSAIVDPLQRLLVELHPRPPRRCRKEHRRLVHYQVAPHA